MKRLIPLVPALYILFLMLPIYWLLNMSFKTTNEILGGFSLWPREFTLENSLGQFDLGRGAAMSLIYLIITLLVSWVFYTTMTRDDDT